MKLQRIALAAGVAGIAAAYVAFGASGAESTRTIKATLVYTSLTQIDADHNGKPSAGDFAVSPGFYVNSTGKRIGTVGSSCLQITPAGSYNCTDYSHFPGGDIITADRFSLTEKTFKEAILGGTGAYAGMTGVVEGRWLATDFSKARLIFDLRP
jgi:hypothetical protein